MSDATRFKPPMMVLHKLCGSARICFLPGWVAKPLSYIVTQLMASLKSPFRWRLHWKSSQSSGETLQAPLIATQSVTSPGLTALFRSRKVRTLTSSLGSDGEDVHSQSSSFFHLWFNVVADECTSCLEHFHTLSFYEETGQMGERMAVPWTRQTGQNYCCTCSFHSDHSWLWCVWSCELKYWLPQLWQTGFRNLFDTLD